jgi:hypothetical protein
MSRIATDLGTCGPPTELIPGYSVDGDRDFYVGDERFELDLAEEIDLHTIQTKDWW